MVQGGARPKTPRMDSTPLAHPSTQPLIPRRILSSTPSGENGEKIDKRSTLIRNIEEKREKYWRNKIEKISIHPL